jgi:Tfp pilus assembly protein PilW
MNTRAKIQRVTLLPSAPWNLANRLNQGWIDNTGWSLIESLLGLGIMLIILLPALTFLINLQSQYQADRSGSEARDNARAALLAIARLIESAGNNPHGVTLHAVRIDNMSTLAIEADLTGSITGLPDGLLEDAFEKVTLAWDASARQITIASGGGNHQPLARCITQLEFSGMNRNGELAASVPDIAYIRVHLHAQADVADLRTRNFQEVQCSIYVPILSRIRFTP